MLNQAIRFADFLAVFRKLEFLKISIELKDVFAMNFCFLEDCFFECEMKSLCCAKLT